MKTVCLVLMCLGLAACKLPISPESLRDQSFEITVYDGTMPIKSYRAEPGSQTHGKILKLMRHHKKGWKPNFVSYAPSVVVKGNGFAINYQGYGAVYNGGLGQMHRKVTAADYQFLVSN